MLVNLLRTLILLPLFFIHCCPCCGLLQTFSSVSVGISGPYGFQNQSRSQLSPVTSLPFGTGVLETSAVFKTYVPPPEKCRQWDTNCSHWPWDLTDQCLLWDDSCSGNRTEAISEFFGKTRPQLSMYGSCFADDPSEQECGKDWPLVQSLLSWMRTPQCLATMNGWMGTPQGVSAMVDWANVRERPIKTYNGTSCCGLCNLSAQNVNVYYWPEPNASTACLDVVGTSVRPLSYGATTAPNGDLYWGCTSLFSGISGVFQTYTTAFIAKIMSPEISIKSYWENPWSPIICAESTDDKAKTSSSSSSSAHRSGASLRARAHSLVIPPSITKQDGAPMSTVVSGGFTFTSPFIYVEFSYLSAHELSCAGTSISSTMLRFTSGELSTLEISVGSSSILTKPFDFRDLPCPPQHVMERVWYKPQPGEPYRPFLAAPKQKLIDEIAPWFTNCDDALFSGYDPPKTLVLASAMVTDATSSDPLGTPTSPRPSPTQDPGARKTAAATDPSAAAAYTAALRKPKETSNAAADPQQQEVPDPGFQSSQPRTQRDRQTESGSETHSIDPQQQSGVAGRLGQAVYSSAPNEAMPTSIAASNGKNAQPGVGTGKDSDLQQSKSAGQRSGDATIPAARSKITGPTQQDYAEGVSGDPTELADTSKGSASPQPDNAGVEGQYPAEGTTPSKPLNPAQANYANGANGGSAEADGTSKTGDPAQTSYTRGNGEDAGHIAKISNPSIPQYTREGSSSYDPSNLLPDQRSKIDSALASAPQMSTPTQYLETTSAVGAQSQTSSAAGNDGDTEPGAQTDRPSSPEHTTEGYNLSPFLPDHMFSFHSALAPAAHKPTLAQNQGPKLHQSVSPPSGGGPESGNSPLGTLQSSAKPNASGQENSRVPAATISLEGHAAIIGPPGVGDLPDGQRMGQVQTVDGEIIAPLSNGVSILGAILTPSAQPTTMSGTGTFLAPSGRVVGTGSVKFAPAPPPEPLTTTIAGQAIIANPTAIEVAGSTISAGGPNAVIGGQTVSLDSSSNMIVGSKSIFLATSSAGLGELVIGGFGTESDSSINIYKPSDPTRGRSSSSMDLSSHYAGSLSTNTRLTYGSTGPTSTDKGTPSNETGSSSSNIEPSLGNFASLSTNAAQGSSETGPVDSPAPTGRSTSPRTGLLWKPTMASVLIILILTQM